MNNGGLDFFGTHEFWMWFYSILNFIFLAIDIALFVGFIYALIHAWKYRPKFRLSKKTNAGAMALRMVVFKERWEEVLKRMAIQTSDSMRLAILEADALVDSILKELGFEGDHMADRLAKITPESLLCIDRLWRAHRLRNELVHTPDYTIETEKAQQTIEDYESFMKEIKIL
ncbi:MAG: hypothetical protein NUV53_03685 [Patescibacteria group bacterium]|nr:hypothetical protein [Patescibacteria group bacterium]